MSWGWETQRRVNVSLSGPVSAALTARVDEAGVDGWARWPHPGRARHVSLTLLPSPFRTQPRTMVLGVRLSVENTERGSGCRPPALTFTAFENSLFPPSQCGDRMWDRGRMLSPDPVLAGVR